MGFAVVPTVFDISDSFVPFTWFCKDRYDPGALHASFAWENAWHLSHPAGNSLSSFLHAEFNFHCSPSLIFRSFPI